jgi:hypothetical protein
MNTNDSAAVIHRLPTHNVKCREVRIVYRAEDFIKMPSIFIFRFNYTFELLRYCLKCEGNNTCSMRPKNDVFERRHTMS